MYRPYNENNFPITVPCAGKRPTVYSAYADFKSVTYCSVLEKILLLSVEMGKVAMLLSACYAVMVFVSSQVCR